MKLGAVSFIIWVNSEFLEKPTSAGQKTLAGHRKLEKGASDGGLLSCSQNKAKPEFEVNILKKVPS